MALNWEWSQNCGEATFEQTWQGETKEFTVTLYQGNALLIMLNEFEEDGKKMWNMYNFFVDKEHAKRCLGLDKNYSSDNIFDDGITRLTKIRFNKKRMGKADLKALVTMLVQAFDNVNIEIYSE